MVIYSPILISTQPAYDKPDTEECGENAEAEAALVFLFKDVSS